jgi:rhodanese-related sulfurtransferase/DNA-binding MarR family transcriptional regulator
METPRNGKMQLYEVFAEIGKALSSASRLELIDLLSQAPHTVEEVAEKAHLSLANASQHLQRLKAAGLVTAEREGTYIRYQLAGPAVARLLRELQAVGAQYLAAVAPALNAYRPQRHTFATIGPDELASRLARDEVILLDVRPRAEYEAGHLPQAVSMPLAELSHRLPELPADRLVVTYCRGPYCVYADQALALLQARGRPGARLEEGVTEWVTAGRALAGEAPPDTP